MSPVGQNLFEALRQSLADFRGKVEGEPGRKVSALGSRTGTLPDLVRQVLSAVADALAWLGGALHSAADALRVADAAIALIELAGDLLGAFAEGLSFGELPESFGLDPAPFKAVSDAVTAGNAVLEKGVHAVGVLPKPEDLAGVRQELELLLGKRVNPALPGPGALGKLLSDVQPAS